MSFLRQFSFEFMVAKRFFDSKRGFISVNSIFASAGIMLGVAALIIVMSIMNGFHAEISKKFIGANGDVLISKFGAKELSLPSEISEKITNLKNVKTASKLVSGQGLLSFSGKSLAFEARGLEFSELEKKKLISDNLIAGNASNLQDPSKIAIGIGMAHQLGAVIGDHVRLIAPGQMNSLVGAIPRSKTFEIGAVFKSGMHLYDTSLIFMNFAAEEKFFGKRNVSHFLEVNLDAPEKSDFIKEEIVKILDDAGFENVFLVKDWKEMNSQIFNALKTEKVAMFSILTLIIIVAAFNIISSLVMLVASKKKNIAILRSFGMQSASVLRIFMICGSFIGVLGTILGVLLGFLISHNIEHVRKFLENFTGTNLFDPLIYYLSYLPSQMNLSDVLTISLISLILSFCATILPALHASKMNILSIFRGGE